MDDLYNIGYFEDAGDKYRINFTDSSPLYTNTGSNGALFNLSDRSKTWSGAGRTDADTFLLPDLTQLSLDGFVEQAVGFLMGGNDYGIEFSGTDQNDAFYLDGFDEFVESLTSNDVDAWINYRITEGKDIVVFPDELNESYSEMAPIGVLGSWGIFDDYFWDYYDAHYQLGAQNTGFFENVGTDDADTFYGESNSIAFGLDGADVFTSGLYSDEQVFVGGEGSDTYRIDQSGFMTVFDGGYTGTDKVEATGIGISNDSTYVATIEGRHLWVYDNYSDQGIVVIDFMDPESKIESIKLQDGSYNYDQIIEAVSYAPNSLGDVSWDYASSYVSPQSNQSIDDTIDFYKNWHQTYSDLLNNHSWDGLTYKFSKSDVQVSSDRDDDRVYVDTKAENVYKIFDNRLADDVFVGSDGMQVFRSEGGYDTASGGKGFDVFRADGSMLTDDEWGDQQVYEFVGHQLKVTDYEFGELLSIEDFGLNSASQIYSTIENGYTKIWAQTEFGEYNPIKIVGEFDTGIVYSKGTKYSDSGVDYRVVFMDTSDDISGTSGNDDLAVFGDVWKADLDVAHIISDVSSSGQLLDGGDGEDDFAGGAGNDHFSGGDGVDRVLYLDSAGIGVGLSEDLTHTVIYDGMGYGGVDTLDSISHLYASTGNDYIDLSTNPDEIERIIPSFGDDHIIGNVIVGYWNLFNSPDDPRYSTEWKDGVQNGVYNAWVEVDLANQLATKNIQGGQFEGTYTDILDGTRGVVGSEGDDIFKVSVNTEFSMSDDAYSPDQGSGWAHGMIGDDFIEDLGSGYDWLSGGAGDDIVISGHYQDVVYGDWTSDYYAVEGADTFAIVGGGYTEIMDWELGEEVWWLSSAGDNSDVPSSAEDIVITYDYGKQTTILGYQDGNGQLVNRIEINGLLQLETAYMEEFYAASASASIADGELDARLVLSEADSLPYQITDLGSGSDKFYGGDEFDLVTTNGGADWIMAGAGDDMVIVNGTVLSTDTNPLDGRSNYVLIDTGTGNDIVNVTTDFSGEVQLVSGGGADTLVVAGEAASFSWGADDDNLVLTSADATLVLVNQMGYDENQVFSYVEFISVDPVTGQETSQIFQIDPNADAVEGGIVTLLGTDKDDIIEIEFDSGPASIAGLKGDDIIEGGMSDDSLDGGEGDDFLSGNSGDDSLAGGEGDDFLDGEHGSDSLFGGLGDDVYKFDLEYHGFLDQAGYDNVILNDDGTIDYELSPESPWDDVIGGVDTITDDGGADRIWITNFQPTLNPFDQYREMLSIDSDGTLIMKWGWDAESPSSYQYTLREGFEYQPFDPVAQAAHHDGGYVVTKSNVNNTNEQPTYTWPVFAEKWQAENFYSDQYGFEVPAVVHKVTVDPSKVAYEDGSRGSALEHTKAQTLEFWVPGPEGSFNEGSAPDFTSYPGMVNVADTLYYNSLDNGYHQGGDLSSLEEAGQHTEFDIGRIETWPGFTDLPEATDPANPEVGTQQYYEEQFVLGNSDTYPSVTEMPFVDVINNNLVSMADIQSVVDGEQGDFNNLYPASVSNDNAELAQGFKVTDFAVKDEYGNWVNTIESIVFTSPTGEHGIVDEYGADWLAGKKSAHDSLTDALKDGYGTEYFLSPSGVVDLGTVRTPTGFNADGTPKGFKEANNWQGAETDKNFFLIANADMAGLNDSGLGFNGSTSDVSVTGDRDAATPITMLSNDILMSGAARDDIMVGYDGSDYVDVMFGHGGDDYMAAEGGENVVVGGAGADKFIIEAKAQDTLIIGDHFDVNTDGTDIEFDNNGNAVTTNDSYGDAIFFDFAWPALIPNPSYDPNGPVDAINNPEMIRDGDTYIEQLGNNHFKVHHKLENGEEINVEMYDVEGAYFSDGMGGIEYHALTSGRAITSDDFGKLAYDKGDVKFWVEHDDADYGGATTIAVVTTATKTVTDPVTKQKISYEEPSVKWKGLASEANSFEFSDITINVINVAQTDVTGAPIVDATVYGTSGIDLIVGDEFDNLIFGGDDNDIIFSGAGNDEIYGEGGDDVIIGGIGEDILYGDYHEDALKPAEELDSRGNVMNASELDGDDIIVGGDGIDKIDTGEGENVVASGDLNSVILNTELDEMHTFLDYDEDDLPV